MKGSSEVSINGIYKGTIESNDGMPVFKKAGSLPGEEPLWLVFVEAKRRWYIKSNDAYRNKASKSSIAYMTCGPRMNASQPGLCGAKWKVAKRDREGLGFKKESLMHLTVLN